MFARTLVAMALTVAATSAAEAKDWEIYGKINVSAQQSDEGEGSFGELKSNASRIGVKGDYALEHDLTLIYQLEWEVDLSDEANEKNLKSRNQFIGLKGDFGQARVGRFDSPFKVARGPVNFFGDQLGDIRNVTRAGNLRFDERNANTIEYKSPKFGNGFNVLGALSLHEANSPDASKDGEKDKDKAYDLALTYKEGKVDFAAAYEHYEEEAARGERDGFRIAGAYKITPEFNLGGLYQFLQHDNSEANPDAQVFGVAADYKVAPKTYVRGQVFHRDVDTEDANSTLLAVGVEHRLDKAVRVYANLATMLNDKNADLTPWKEGRSFGNSVKGAKDENSTALSLGFRYDF